MRDNTDEFNTNPPRCLTSYSCAFLIRRQVLQYSLDIDLIIVERSLEMCENQICRDFSVVNGDVN